MIDIVYNEVADDLSNPSVVGFLSPHDLAVALGCVIAEKHLTIRGMLSFKE